jgi:hypothetical protein
VPCHPGDAARPIQAQDILPGRDVIGAGAVNDVASVSARRASMDCRWEVLGWGIFVSVRGAPWGSEWAKGFVSGSHGDSEDGGNVQSSSSQPSQARLVL